MSKFTKKLGSDPNYKRPKVTTQETFTAEEIAERLQGYVEFIDWTEVDVGTHIRYFQVDEHGDHKYRNGGLLKNKMNADKYVILTNGKNDWSVQTATGIFYRKMSHNEEVESLHELYRKKMEDKDKMITKLKSFIKKNLGVSEIPWEESDESPKLKVKKTKTKTSKTKATKTKETKTKTTQPKVVVTKVKAKKSGSKTSKKKK